MSAASWFVYNQTHTARPRHVRVDRSYAAVYRMAAIPPIWFGTTPCEQIMHLLILRSIMIGTFALPLIPLFVTPCRGEDHLVVIDFEDGNLDRWRIVDEPSENLREKGPSLWDVMPSGFGLDDHALIQRSNIWGDAQDRMLMGTIIYYAEQQFTNFLLEVDVVAFDNDGVGLVWGYNDLDQHYRVMMINSESPEQPSIDGHQGPMLIAHRRVSNQAPWYELLEVVDDPDQYVPFPQGVGQRTRFKLQVLDGNFTFTSRNVMTEDEVTISGFDDTYSIGYVGIQLYGMSVIEFDNLTIKPLGGPRRLWAGDADEDLDVDQLDLVKVQIAAKYQTGQPATWGEGDWDGAPGGEPGNPPPGDGLFNQHDIIAVLTDGLYLQGPYAALSPGGGVGGDGQTTIVYDPSTGEVGVDAPAGIELTSLNMDSSAGIFTGTAARNLGGSFDNDADHNIFKATFGSSFGSISFGNVAQVGLSESFVRDDLTVVGSLAGGGDLGSVDLIYVPESGSMTLLMVGLAILVMRGFSVEKISASQERKSSTPLPRSPIFLQRWG